MRGRAATAYKLASSHAGRGFLPHWLCRTGCRHRRSVAARRLPSPGGFASSGRIMSAQSCRWSSARAGFTWPPAWAEDPQHDDAYMRAPQACDAPWARNLSCLPNGALACRPEPRRKALSGAIRPAGRVTGGRPVGVTIQECFFLVAGPEAGGMGDREHGGRAAIGVRTMSGWDGKQQKGGSMSGFVRRPDGKGKKMAQCPDVRPQSSIPPSTQSRAGC